MVKVTDISKKYGAFTALHPSSLEIERGQFAAILGPSGSGKTTLLRILAGLESPDEGEVWINDQKMNQASSKFNLAPEKRNIGMVFQDFALWPHMSVFEMVAFPLKAKKVTGNLEEKVWSTLKMVRLESKAKNKPHELSGGEQQRVAFARAVVAGPPFILLDEPLSALDALLRQEMRLELKNLMKKIGLTSLFVTHDQAEALSMADKVFIMEKGKIVQKGSPEEIYYKPRTTFVADFVGLSNWLEKNKKMVRPECVSLKRSQREEIEIPLKILESGFLGDRYEVRAKFLLDQGDLEKGEQIWTLFSSYPLERGSNCTVYVHPQKIHELGKT